MNYVVSLGSEVNFDPETEVVEILQTSGRSSARAKERCLWIVTSAFRGTTSTSRLPWLRC